MYERHQNRLIGTIYRQRATSELLLWFNFVPPTHLPPVPVSMTVIYRTRNDHSFRLFDYSPVFLPSFCTMYLAGERHRLKSYIDENLEFPNGTRKCMLTNVFKSKIVFRASSRTCVQNYSSIGRQIRQMPKNVSVRGDGRNFVKNPFGSTGMHAQTAKSIARKSRNKGTVGSP